MEHNTTRPVAVNAEPRTTRRGPADNGVRANGKEQASLTEGPSMANYRDYRRMGWSRPRALILAFWDLPALRNI